MKRLILLLSLSLTVVASAAEITVKGKHISDTRCRYTSTSTGSFVIDYRENLKWGDRVFAKIAYHNNYNGMEWFDEQVVEMKSVSPYSWSARIVDMVTSRGDFAKGQLKFVFMIEDLDGNVRYDKGSDSIWGYYRVYIPRMTCNNSDPLNSLYIESVIK